MVIQNDDKEQNLFRGTLDFSSAPGTTVSIKSLQNKRLFLKF
jgi:hypothetical protein